MATFHLPDGGQLEIPDALVRAFSYREALHQLGFDEDHPQIRFSRLAPANAAEQPRADEIAVAVHMRRDLTAPPDSHDPARDFHIVCGNVHQDWGVDAARICEVWNQLPREMRVKAFNHFVGPRTVVALGEAMARKGFDVPVHSA